MKKARLKDVENKEAIRLIDNIMSEIQTLYHLIEGNGSAHKIDIILMDLENIKKDVPLKPIHNKYCPICGRYIDRCGGLIDDCSYCGQKKKKNKLGRINNGR